MPVWCDIYPDGGMVDTYVLGTYDVSRVGSSPTWGTIDILNKVLIFILTWTQQCVIQSLVISKKFVGMRLCFVVQTEDSKIILMYIHIQTLNDRNEVRGFFIFGSLKYWLYLCETNVALDKLVKSSSFHDEDYGFEPRTRYIQSLSSVGRALALHASCRRFNSYRDYINLKFEQ